MENSIDMLIMAFGAVIFSIGISLFMFQTFYVNELVQIQQKCIYSNNVMY